MKNKWKLGRGEARAVSGVGKGLAVGLATLLVLLLILAAAVNKGMLPLSDSGLGAKLCFAAASILGGFFASAASKKAKLPAAILTGVLLLGAVCLAVKLLSMQTQIKWSIAAVTFVCVLLGGILGARKKRNRYL